MRDIEISIGEIVLDGVEVPDEAAFRESLVASLTTLASAHKGSIGEGCAAELQGAALSGVDNLGSRVAQSVWGALA
jgi:hypothetical protein